jgi:hypothetical protein
MYTRKAPYRLNESKLKQIVNEAVKRVLNEIADTSNGLFNLVDAGASAYDQGRLTSYHKINNYKQGKLPQGILTLEKGKIAYKNFNGNVISILGNGTVEVGGRASGYSINELQRIPKDWRVNDPKVARFIVNYIKRFVTIPRGRGVNGEILNYHSWLI